MDLKLEEQKKLATFIKSVHEDLRNSSIELGADQAWQKHLKDKEKLNLYAKSMRELSENHWKERNGAADDRIEWIISNCNRYFEKNELESHRKKDLEIIEKLKDEECEIEMNSYRNEIEQSDTLNVIDVGSSGNFFKKHSRFKLLPIDIAPSSDEVFFCDFLSVEVSNELKKDDDKIFSLPTCYFDVVIFCLLLEYLPSSEMRITCCEKAYEILKTEGVLIIVTPDSNSQHINAQQIKNWKYVLSQIGFKRIKIEKLKNLSCMIFRKSLSRDIPRRWAMRYKEPYMDYKLEIPQDRKRKHSSE